METPTDKEMSWQESQRLIDATKRPSIDVELKPAPYSDRHWLGVVTTAKGRCFYVTIAGEQRPTEERIREIWATDRACFLPYVS